MNRIILISVIFISFLLPEILFSQDIILTSQAEVDAFDPATTVINGSLTIGDDTFNSNITNLSNLSNITSIGGNLWVGNNPSLTNIDGLSGITSVGVNLEIFNNGKLTNVDGLSGLTSISGTLIIKGNQVLNNVDGLSGIKSVEGILNINSNYALTNVDGLSGLTVVPGLFYIQYNNALTNVDGLSGIKSVEGILNINGNDALTNVDGLSGITSVEGGLSIFNDVALTNVDGLSNITSVPGELKIIKNDALINLDGLSGITSIAGTLSIEMNDKLINIDGLSGISSIEGTLSIRYNKALTNIDGLSGITSIEGSLGINDNKALNNIDGLSGLTSIAGTVSISSNHTLPNVDGLSGLTSIAGYLYIRLNNAMTNIDSLSGIKSVAGRISIYHNELLINVNGLSGLTSIAGTLRIESNDNLINIDGLSGITSVEGTLNIFHNNALHNIDGLSGLTSIAGTLEFWQNNALTNVDGLAHITSVDGKLNITNNAALTDCCGIQHLIYKYGLNRGILNIWNNPSECSSTEEIKISRCYDYEYVEGKVYFDGNIDGCDSLDVYYPNIKIRILQNSDNDYVISNKSGTYRYFIREESEIALLPVYDNKFFKVEPDTLIINYPADSLNLVHDFCITPIKNFDDLEITIIPLTQARPGFDADYEISYKNNGTNIISDEIEFYYDDILVSFKSADPAEDSIYENTIKWYYTDLLPFEQRKINVKLELNKPTDNPPLNGGDMLTHAAKIYPVDGDNTKEDNSFRLIQTVVNSFDPNDKTCLNGDVFDIQKIGDYVNYLIRFENLGTAEAVYIKVVDVIDTSLFDISTLVITSSSHNCITNIHKDTVEFFFEHIFLDYNDDKNDGFIAFKIRTWPTLSSGTILENVANIYFDYNLPVKTNVATTIVKEIVATRETDHGSWQIFPNPTEGRFHISTDRPGNYTISLFDSYGKIVYSSKKLISNITELQFNNLPSGLYFLRIEDNGDLFYNEKVLIFR